MQNCVLHLILDIFGAPVLLVPFAGLLVVENRRPLRRWVHDPAGAVCALGQAPNER